MELWVTAASSSFVPLWSGSLRYFVCELYSFRLRLCGAFPCFVLRLPFSAGGVENLHRVSYPQSLVRCAVPWCGRAFSLCGKACMGKPSSTSCGRCCSGAFDPFCGICPGILSDCPPLFRLGSGSSLPLHGARNARALHLHLRIFPYDGSFLPFLLCCLWRLTKIRFPSLPLAERLSVFFLWRALVGCCAAFLHLDCRLIVVSGGWAMMKSQLTIRVHLP